MSAMSALLENPKIHAPIPRLPVLGWNTLGGSRHATIPCVLEHPAIQFTTSGRASILLALEILGIKAGDRVLVPTYHCPTMVAPIVALGAEPVFYPINTLGSIDFDWLKQQDLTHVRVILAAHFFGLPQPMRALRLWCDANQIALIEDCAHALFGSSEGQPIGQWGDLAIASLTKFLPVTEGGCLTINMSKAKMPAQTQPGAVRQIKAAIDMIHLGTMFKRFYGLNTALAGTFSLVHAPRKTLRNIRTPSESASVNVEDSPEGFSIDVALSHQALTAPCRWLAENSPRARIVEQRRKHFMAFIDAFSDHLSVWPLIKHLPEDCAPYVFPLWVANPDPGYIALREMGIPLSRWDRPWHNVPEISGDQGSLWSHHILQLPCHQDLSPEDLDILVREIRRAYH
ncbi:DegT/DnrJ/EryC1/StrS family aminotransferase [Chitinimonas sp. PSY-7]|uniref:DegT/DnrJ/EryC1/StrS family aminotransferase n=1 Tax=Chitinimonas sp. PSY-7 TaxID=3459088 RepID=UPI004040002F